MGIKIGFSDTFFTGITKLQPNIQAKVNQAVLKFQTNPKANGLNFEKLNYKDKSMRSIRVDQAYRIIVSAPQQGNVYLFLWVDHHDEAYAWAESHTCSINPNTGSIQLYASEVIEAEAVSHADTSLPKFFDAKTYKDRHLLKLGVPEDQLEIVREVVNEAGLDRLQGILPDEAYEGLYLIMAGESYENILLDREVEEGQTFDVNNFEEALNRFQSQASFMVPETDVELNTMLNAPMDKWRVFLHPSQRKLVQGKKNGAVRVLGGAGTGKTVVAIHRAKWLADQITGDEKVLFTTFTKNLAIDIKNNLQSICTPEQMKKIEVINLDRWVQTYLRSHTYDYEVVFDERRLDDCWNKALSEKTAEIDFPDVFFKEEWARVIQPQGVTDLAGYKKASRIGRGTRLNRQQRVRIWPVFEEYRYQLDRARMKETDDAYRDAAQLLANQQGALDYHHVVVDEAQDMSSQAFKLLRAVVPEQENDLFIVGDAHQRIYGKNKVVLSHCGINIRGRSSRLKINYRTTDEIRAWATQLLKDCFIDDLDGEQDTSQGYKSLTHGHPPFIENFQTAQDQAEFIKGILDKSELPNSHTCVVARTNNEVKNIQQLLENLGIPTSIIKPSEPEIIDSDILRLATVHRVKGLEFDQLILASANEGLLPLEYVLKDKADQVSMEDAKTEERSLVYVAITRARKSAFILSYGKQSFLLPSI